ncbi:MAG: LPS export ABC transporter periplasmic protein LptC [Pseudomonadota bacterium]
MILPAPASGSAVHVPWSWRVRELVSAYLPLLLMLLLALATWWLVKNTPKPEEPRGPVVPRHEPDYTMQRFAVQRFAPDGRLRVRIEGEQLRHYPDTDTVEIDTVRVHAVGEDGRITEATARQALANGDASEVQLLGGAQVSSRLAEQVPIEFEGEFLHAFLQTERLRSHLPVQVRQGANTVRAQGLDYDNLTRVVRLQGPVQARFAPAERRGR